MKVIQVWIDKGSGFRQMIFDGTEEDKRKIVELVKEALENGWLMQIYQSRGDGNPPPLFS